MELTANALAVLRQRYLIRREREKEGTAHADTANEERGPFEQPEDLFRRVAVAIGAVDRDHGATPPEVEVTTERFFRRMTSLEFLPNSPTLMNAGRKLGQLSACFVVPVEDSTDGIFDSVRAAALIQKTGGGTGFSFSRLRPAGDRVDSTGGVASGPVPFMQVFDVATEAVKQGGTRRGANMGILRVDHPDVLDFIALKLDQSRMRNFNLSVAATDVFMEAVAAGATYELRNPRTGTVVRTLDARRVFELIANAAWTTGDPGLVFIDRINATQPNPDLGMIEATNPCGEQPLLPFESCTLASINVARFVIPGELGKGAIDHDRLRDCVRDGVHFLDNVIDANRYPMAEIEAATHRTRKIGLGVMGFADALIELGVAYDSPEALVHAETIAALFESESLEASADLAAVRGAYPAYPTSRWASGELGTERELRNATTTTVAPTGTISIIAGCSSGIEPLYAIAYERNVLDGQILREVNQQFRSRAEARGIWSKELEAVLAERGRVRGLDMVPEDLQRLFPTAHDVPAEQHIRVQAAFQRHVHAAVSKTINLPGSARPKDVAEAYRFAYEAGCKGVTVYRDGSRDEQVLAFGDERVRASGESGGDCPECSRELTGSKRCRVCASCGWSACS